MLRVVTTTHDHGNSSMNEQRNQRFLKLPAVKARTCLSRSAIYQLMAQHQFPRCVSLSPPPGRAVAWVESEIDAWIAARITQRRAVAR
jgi:prophage regulatory protein